MRALDRLVGNIGRAKDQMRHALNDSLQALLFDVTEMPRDINETPKVIAVYSKYKMCNGKVITVPMNSAAAKRHRLVG
jgi:hypothetical protein